MSWGIILDRTAGLMLAEAATARWGLDRPATAVTRPMVSPALAAPFARGSEGGDIRLGPVRLLEAVKMASPTLTGGDLVGLTAHGLV